MFTTFVSIFWLFQWLVISIINDSMLKHISEVPFSCNESSKIYHGFNSFKSFKVESKLIMTSYLMKCRQVTFYTSLGNQSGSLN